MLVCSLETSTKAIWVINDSLKNLIFISKSTKWCPLLCDLGFLELLALSTLVTWSFEADAASSTLDFLDLLGAWVKSYLLFRLPQKHTHQSKEIETALLEDIYWPSASPFLVLLSAHSHFLSFPSWSFHSIALNETHLASLSSRG